MIFGCMATQMNAEMLQATRKLEERLQASGDCMHGGNVHGRGTVPGDLVFPFPAPGLPALAFGLTAKNAEMLFCVAPPFFMALG